VITVAEALSRLRTACAAGPIERAPLSDGLGRVLGSDLPTDVDWPPFDTSAMDGYAVRVADAARALVERAGPVAAGDLPPAPLEAGEAVRVMTGAPLPPGTEAHPFGYWVIPVALGLGLVILVGTQRASRRILSWMRSRRPPAPVAPKIDAVGR
jgi:hypothetical protein